MDQDRLSPAVLRVVRRAWQLARDRGVESVSLADVWTGLRLEEGQARDRLLAAGLAFEGTEDLKPLPPLPAARLLGADVNAVISEADTLARRQGRHVGVESDHLLWVVVNQDPFRDQASAAGFDFGALEEAVEEAGGVTTKPLATDLSIEEAARPAVDDGAVVLRILDASANRLAEGLRVVEDYLRFGLDDADLSERCKQLRHDVRPLLNHLPAEVRTAVRDVPGDVGTEIVVPAEKARGDSRSVAAANLQRAFESLRSLEEYAKTVDGELARDFEKLRYRAYSLHKQVARTEVARDRMTDCRVMLLVGLRDLPMRLETLVEAALAGGVDAVQLREKAADDRELLDAAHELRRLTRSADALFFVNDRPDVAVLSRADGVHVGQEDLSCEETRRIVGGEMLIGVSTHSLDQALAAREAGADLIGVGPTFPSETKSFDAFAGLDYVRKVASAITLPAFAIGGVHGGNAAEVAAAGLGRVAVSRAVTHADHPQHAARVIREALESCPLA